MKLQDRFDQERIRPSGEDAGSSPGASGDNLEQLRRQAGELLAAADEAIRKALSADSRRFLQANRQQGGQ